MLKSLFNKSTQESIKIDMLECYENNNKIEVRLNVNNSYRLNTIIEKDGYNYNYTIYQNYKMIAEGTTTVISNIKEEIHNIELSAGVKPYTMMTKALHETVSLIYELRAVA